MIRCYFPTRQCSRPKLFIACFVCFWSKSPDLIVNIWSHIELKQTGRKVLTTRELLEAINNKRNSFSCKKLSTDLPTWISHLKKRGSLLLYTYI